MFSPNNIPSTFAELTTYIFSGRSMTQRKLAHNTWGLFGITIRDGEPRSYVDIKFHQTIIATVWNDDVLDVCLQGWATRTTVVRLNGILERRAEIRFRMFNPYIQLWPDTNTTPIMPMMGFGVYRFRNSRNMEIRDMTNQLIESYERAA